LNGFTGLSELMVQGLSYFFKVNSAPNFEKKTPSTVESGFEPQNLLKFCPNYCFKKLANRLTAYD